jgi:hypothetical protein
MMFPTRNLYLHHLTSIYSIYVDFPSYKIVDFMDMIFPLETSIYSGFSQLAFDTGELSPWVPAPRQWQWGSWGLPPRVRSARSASRGDLSRGGLNPLAICHIAIENGPLSSLIYLLKIVILHMLVYQRVLRSFNIRKAVRHPQFYFKWLV